MTMILRKSLEWFGGSLVVYLAVVACGSNGGAPQKVAETGGETSTGGSDRGGSGGAATGGNEGGFGFGGFPDPTPDAGAAEAGDGPGPTTCDCPKPPDPYVPPEPLVVEAECDVVVQVNTNLSNVYAVIDKPSGLSSVQVERGSVVLEYASPAANLPPGDFTTAGAGFALSPTQVLAYCGSRGTTVVAAPAESARFIFPR